MLSRSADGLPEGDGWLFEPKWDGFRTLVFRDGDEILLQSRDEKPMNRYFPELVAPLAAALPDFQRRLAQIRVADRKQVPGDERGRRLLGARNLTRDAAGRMRSSSASKSSPAAPTMTISPSTTQRPARANRASADRCHAAGTPLARHARRRE